jgi:hypothetical protein
MRAMKKAFDDLKVSYVKGNRRRALARFFENLKEGVDFKGRWEEIKALFRDHRHAVNDVFRWEDPLPGLGVFYPLAVFLKHGKISTELLVSEGRAGMKDGSKQEPAQEQEPEEAPERESAE